METVKKSVNPIVSVTFRVQASSTNVGLIVKVFPDMLAKLGLGVKLKLRGPQRA